MALLNMGLPCQKYVFGAIKISLFADEFTRCQFVQPRGRGKIHLFWPDDFAGGHAEGLAVVEWAADRRSASEGWHTNPDDARARKVIGDLDQRLIDSDAAEFVVRLFLTGNSEFLQAYTRDDAATGRVVCAHVRGRWRVRSAGAVSIRLRLVNLRRRRLEPPPAPWS